MHNVQATGASRRGGTRRGARANGTIGTADIFNNDILAKDTPKPLTIKPRKTIRTAACGKRRNDTNGTIWPIRFLRARNAGRNQRRTGAKRE